MSQTTLEAQADLKGTATLPDRTAARPLPRPRRRSPRFSLASGIVILVCADAVAALMAPRLASALIVPAPTMASGPVNLLLYGGTTILALLFCGFYGLGAARAPLDHAGRLLRGLLSAHVLVLLHIALVRPAPESLPLGSSIGWAAAVFAFAATLIVAGRFAIAAWWRHFDIGAPRGAAALVAGGPCERHLCAQLDRLADHRLGYMFCWRAAAASGLRMITDVAAFEAMIRSGQVNEIVAFIRRGDSAGTRRRIDALLARLADQPVRIRLAFDAVAEIGAHELAIGPNLRMVTVLDRPLGRAGRLIKRTTDIAGAMLLLLLTAPLFVIISLILCVDGPVLFRQRRVGLNGAPFTVFKFRTMRPATSDRRGRPAAIRQACPGDARITRLGATLRRFSLDELPQLFNVLRGEMSLVGPRPHAPHTYTGEFTFEQALAFYRVRHRIKPGLTGLAQVRGLRGPAARPDLVAARVAADLDYIERWSPWLDFTILLRTVPAVLGGRNAF